MARQGFWTSSQGLGRPELVGGGGAVHGGPVGRGEDRVAELDSGRLSSILWEER